MTILKHERYTEALNQLQEILVFCLIIQEIEQKVYGENSTQVGKTLKIIGAIHINNNEANDAEHYLKKAQKILHQQGQVKLVKEIKSKLAYIKEMRENNRSNLLEIVQAK